MRPAVLPEQLHDDAIALWSATGLTRPWNDPHDDLRRAVTGPSSTVLATWAPGPALLGTVMVGHDGHRGWLYYLAVRPDRQGSGLGRDLVAAAEDWLRDRGVPKAQLMVRQANVSVLGFYRALGYEHSDVVVLARTLDRPRER